MSFFDKDYCVIINTRDKTNVNTKRGVGNDCKRKNPDNQVD